MLVDGDIVREVGGRLVFGDAVARIADTLSPLGAAARIVAETGAIAVQLRKLGLEGRRVEAESLATLARLRYRHAEAGSTLQAMHKTVDGTERNARGLRQCIAAAQREMFKPNVSMIEKEFYRDLLKESASLLIDNHAVGGDVLTDHIHEVLNGSESASAGRNQNRSETPRRRGGGQARSRRSR